MPVRASLVRSTLLALALVALAAGSAAAQVCPQNPSGGNRLVATSPTTGAAATRGWYASLLPTLRGHATFRLPGRITTAMARASATRVTR